MDKCATPKGWFTRIVGQRNCSRSLGQTLTCTHLILASDSIATTNKPLGKSHSSQWILPLIVAFHLPVNVSARSLLPPLSSPTMNRARPMSKD